MSFSLNRLQSVILCAFILIFSSELQALAQVDFDWTSVSISLCSHISEEIHIVDCSQIPGSSNLSWVDCYTSPIQCTRLNVDLKEYLLLGEEMMILVLGSIKLFRTQCRRGDPRSNSHSISAQRDFQLSWSSLVQPRRSRYERSRHHRSDGCSNRFSDWARV